MCLKVLPLTGKEIGLFIYQFPIHFSLETLRRAELILSSTSGLLWAWVVWALNNRKRNLRQRVTHIPGKKASVFRDEGQRFVGRMPSGSSRITESQCCTELQKPSIKLSGFKKGLNLGFFHKFKFLLMIKQYMCKNHSMSWITEIITDWKSSGDGCSQEPSKPCLRYQHHSPLEFIQVDFVHSATLPCYTEIVLLIRLTWNYWISDHPGLWLRRAFRRMKAETVFFNLF